MIYLIKKIKKVSDDKIVLTGIKPTGMPHVGNYLGAFKNSIDILQNYKTFMFVADLHALNAVHDAKIVKQHSYEAVAFMIAMGVNLDNTALFRQSDINKIYQLTEFLVANPSEIDAILNQGAERARAVAARVLAKVKKKMLGL